MLLGTYSCWLVFPLRAVCVQWIPFQRSIPGPYINDGTALGTIFMLAGTSCTYGPCTTNTLAQVGTGRYLVITGVPVSLAGTPFTCGSCTMDTLPTFDTMTMYQ
jgi:hypothetical protein